MSALWTALLAYLAGGIPTGVIVSRHVLHKDVRQFGSGNPGAINIWRIFGLGWGLLVVAVDAGKGYVAVKYFPHLAGVDGWGGYPAFLGILAMAGHIWSPFTLFRGGKGTGTACGVALALSPAVGLTCLIVWLLIVAVTRYSSVASLTAGCFYPLAVYWLADPTYSELAIAMLIPAVLIYTHRSNLQRLRDGVELKIGRQERPSEK